jgi:putative transposase
MAVQLVGSTSQDHRAIKRMVRPMLGFKSFRSAWITLQGIELMHLIKKGQLVSGDSQNLSAAGQFIHWPPEISLA